MNNIILLTILTFCWGLQPFFKKIPLKKISSIEFYCIEYLFYMIPITIYFVYLYNKDHLSCFNKVNKKDIFYFVLIITTGTIGGLSFAQLLKQNNASYVVPSVQPLIIIFTLISGYFIFMEKINIYQILGTLMVIFGIVLINFKKFFSYK
jgi:uncharacterized membrane protein